MSMAYVTLHHGETLEDIYLRSDGSDETGYPVPAGLVNELDAAQYVAERARAAIEKYIAKHDVQEVEFDN